MERVGFGVALPALVPRAALEGAVAHKSSSSGPSSSSLPLQPSLSLSPPASVSLWQTARVKLDMDGVCIDGVNEDPPLKNAAEAADAAILSTVAFEHSYASAKAASVPRASRSSGASDMPPRPRGNRESCQRFSRNRPLEMIQDVFRHHFLEGSLQREARHPLGASTV